MSHNHNHTYDSATKNITFVFFLNLIFSFIELIGGIYTNSIAIMSDALHDFSDAISLGISWYLQKYSEKDRDEKYSYGYKRFSLLGSLFISILLLIGSGFVIKESVYRFFHPQHSNPEGMLLLSILGILVNGAAVWKLKKGTSLNEKAVFLHMMEDVLGWIAVLVVSMIMMFINIPALDPLISIGIAIWILSNTYKNLEATLSIFLQRSPKNINQLELKSEIENLTEVISVHDLHIWSIDGEKNIMSIHVVIRENNNLNKLSSIKNDIRTICFKMNIDHVTIEIETEKENCIYQHKSDRR